MTEEHGQNVTFTQQEFQEFIAEMRQTTTDATVSASYRAASLAVEQFANALEDHAVNANSEAARQGAEVALHEAIALARKFSRQLWEAGERREAERQ